MGLLPVSIIRLLEFLGKTIVLYELKSRGRLLRRAAWNVVLGLARKQAGSDELPRFAYPTSISHFIQCVSGLEIFKRRVTAAIWQERSQP